MPAAPNVSAEPNTSPQRRLITPVPAIDIVMIGLSAYSLCNYTILSAAAKMSSMQVIMMNIVITVIGVLLAVFVNVGYGSLLAKTEQ